MHHTSTHSNTANHIYIYHYWPSVLPPHRCRCTHSDSTICLHITLTAPSLPEVGHSVFYAYFYHHLSSHHCTSSLRGRTMSLFTYTYLSQTFVQTVSCDGFGCQLSTSLSTFHPPSIYYMFLVYTFNSSRNFFSAVSCLFALYRFDTSIGHVFAYLFSTPAYLL